MLSEPVPLVIRNAPTALMGQLHYGEGYVYAHDTQEKVAAMQCLPDNLAGTQYYRPGDQGAEKEAARKLEQVKEWKRKHRT